MRKSLLLLLTLLACAGPQKTPGTGPGPTQPALPGRAPRAPVALEEYFNIRRINGASFSHDERLVAYRSDVGGRPDVWVQPVGGGLAVQVTRVSGTLHSYEFSPAADQLVYEADQGGDELPHLFLTNSKGDAPKDLVASYPPGARTEFVRWGDDGKTLLYIGNVRDPKYMDLYEHDLAKGQAALLWSGGDKRAFSAASRDHRRFAIAETLSDVNTNLYLVERGKEGAVLLTPHQGDVRYEALAFSRDGKSLYYTSDEDSEFTALYAMNLKTRKAQKVLTRPWDVERADVSETGRYRWTLSNEDGTVRLVVTDERTRKEVRLPAAPQGGAWEPAALSRPFSRTDRYLAVNLRSDTAPLTAYVLDLKDNAAIRVEDPLPPALRDRPMVSGEVVRVSSFDGQDVPAFVYRPEGAGPFPAVIDVHGGPTSQSRRDFNPLRQYLVSKGYVVMVPNVRGSTGYGKSFTKLDNLDLGGGPLKDVVACKGWLVQNAKVAPDKVVVLGGSYGGYMALAAAAFAPTEFAAHVDYFGVSDLKSLVESFPPYWAAFATSIYQKFGDPKNPEHARYQHDRSPLYFVDRVQRPLLVVQGDKDARVKKDQSDRVVEALRSRKVPVHYLLLKDEGHGFSKNENRLAAYQMTDRFLDRYLFGDTTTPVD